jgi:arginyl-tRNA--protein-N-Asp/Glu arginylyltransferase
LNLEPKHVRVVLLQDLNLKADELSVICNGISYKDTEEILWSATNPGEGTEGTPALSAVNNIPGYYRLTYKKDMGLIVKKYPWLQGFAICLDNYASVDQYMAACFNKKVRGNIKRCLRRLENCYDISYACYYGEIEEDLCKSLLDRLYDMIIARFLERQERSATLEHWEQIKSTLYPWILSKKASLYVISQAGTPICISISYHYGSTLFYYVTSYDIAYSKFSLGNIMIYKQLEKCFKEGGYRFIEMGWGYMDYKRRWCNRTHTFERHLIYPEGSLKGWIFNLVKGNQTSFVAYLQDKPIYRLYNRINAALKNGAAGDSPSTTSYHMADADYAAVAADLTPVPISNRPGLPMKQLLNDFLYNTEEHCKDVRFLEDKSRATLFLKGKRNFKQLIPEG